jgi:hypothetical protein
MQWRFITARCTQRRALLELESNYDAQSVFAMWAMTLYLQHARGQRHHRLRAMACNLAMRLMTRASLLSHRVN